MPIHLRNVASIAFGGKPRRLNRVPQTPRTIRAFKKRERLADLVRHSISVQREPSQAGVLARRRVNGSRTPLPSVQVSDFCAGAEENDERNRNHMKGFLLVALMIGVAVNAIPFRAASICPSVAIGPVFGYKVRYSFGISTHSRNHAQRY